MTCMISEGKICIHLARDSDLAYTTEEDLLKIFTNLFFVTDIMIQIEAKEDSSVSLDVETSISLVLTMCVSFGVNLMTVYGVATKMIAWIVPFFILYSGFIVECVIAIIITLGN